MDGLDEFLQTYRDDRPHWETLLGRAIEKCEAGLKKEDIPANVTGRVKTETSLRKKVQNRWKAITEYVPAKDTRLDYVGLRIMLYFPDQKHQVIRMLKNQFHFEAMRPFDRDHQPKRPVLHQNLFGQYVADHVWVTLHEQDRSGAGKFSKCKFEIQLRSVLMDAWAAISHDLEYKALSGDLTVTELKLLDALKGHVEVGEMMLEQLHRVHRKRTETENQPIQDSLGLADVLADSIPENQISNLPVGDLDALLVGLKALEADTPHGFRAILKGLDANTSLRSNLDQWKNTCWPAPPTVSCYILQQMLPDPRRQKAAFHDAIARARGYQHRDSLDRYWEPLVWLSSELIQSADRREPHYPSGSEVYEYAKLWCASFYQLYLLMTDDTENANDDGCIVEYLCKSSSSLAKSDESSSGQGLNLVAILCLMGIAPTLPEYEEEKEGDAGDDGLSQPPRVHADDTYDEDDDRFQLVAESMRQTYSLHRRAWLEAIYSFDASIVSYHDQSIIRRPDTYRFFRSVDVALWLLNLENKQELLVGMLSNWPFGGLPFTLKRKRCVRDISGLADTVGDERMQRILSGRGQKGFRVLDQESIRSSS